jgi:hypothetical protein
MAAMKNTSVPTSRISHEKISPWHRLPSMHRSRFILQMVTFLTCCSLWLSGCKICATEDCVHGECKTGRCKCEQGWTGAECDRRKKNVFTGFYSVDSRCRGPYNLRILVSQKSGYDLEIIGLHNQWTDTLYAVVDDYIARDFRFPEQPFSPPGYTISGSALGGNENRLTFNYSTKDEIGDYDDICIATMTLK